MAQGEHRTRRWMHKEARDAGASGQRRAATRSVRGSRSEDAVPAGQREARPLQILNGWWDRLISAIYTGTFADETARYASHQTTRDYIMNTVGQTAAGSFFFLITIAATHFAGAEQAGMFALAVTIALLLMFVGNYGVRTYQVSDVREMQSFNDYQIQRIITCAGMLLVGFIYCRLRGYEGTMMAITMGVILFRAFDALADVYEGRLQQKDKLYLAGISQTVRYVVALVICIIVLAIARNLAWACWAMALAEGATVLVVTMPLTYFETERSYPWSKRAIKELFMQCLPLFLALFLYNVLESMPKFAMEGALAYENQLYYMVINGTSQMIVIIFGLVYRPQLVRLARIWANPEQRKRFDLVVLAMFAVIVLIAGLLAAVMMWVGVPVLSFVYGIDFNPYRSLVLVMCAEGGLCAAVDFLYQIITLLREQQSITKLYLIALAFAVPVALLLVNFAQLAGAVIANLVIMAILAVLLVYEYLSIRKRLAEKRW